PPLPSHCDTHTYHADPTPALYAPLPLPTPTPHPPTPTLFPYTTLFRSNSVGVPAELEGRNDLVVNGRKISGNAMFSTKGRMFSHGTLMFDSEIEHVVSALNVSQEKIESKGIKSIRSRVANIAEFLEE